MKIKYLLIIIAVYLFSCTKENIDLNGNGNGNTNEDLTIAENVIPGVITVKVGENELPNFSIKMTKSGGITTGMSDIDRLCDLYNVKSFEPIFHVSGDKYEARKRKAGLHLWYEVKFDESKPLKEVITAFRKIKSFNSVDFVVSVMEVDKQNFFPISAAQLEMYRSNTKRDSEMPFNDPLLSSQWHYNNTGEITNTVAGADINLFSAWQVTTGSEDVIVAILDSGVDIDHEDIKANLWVNTNKSESNPYKDGVHGWNFGTNSAELANPGNPHGTHVAGTVAAVNNNGIGVCGVAGGDGTPGSGAKIMVIQISDNDGNVMSALGLAKSFVYATDNGAVIAQSSWQTGTTMDPVLKTGIDYFIDNAGTDENGVQVGPLKGGLAVFAAGNSGVSGNPVIYPAAYDRVLSVANMGPNYKMSITSSFGPWVGITAPGGELPSKEGSGSVPFYILENGVLSTIPGNQYAFFVGTSMASPHVSGIAALVIKARGGKSAGMTSMQLRELLKDAVRNIDGYIDPVYLGNIGTGLIDAHMAVTAGDFHSIPESVTDFAVDWSKRQSINIQWSVTSDAKYKIASIYEVMISESDLQGVSFDNPPKDVTKFTFRLRSDRKPGDILATTIAGLKGNTKYYLAISALNRYYIRSTNTMIVTGTTFAGTNPEPVTDLSALWKISNNSLNVDLKWTATKDIEAETPIKYEILVSKSDLKDIDFENPPASATKYTFSVPESTKCGDQLSYSIEGLDKSGQYYISIVSLDVDKLRSTPTMTNNVTAADNFPSVTVSDINNILFTKIGDGASIDMKEFFADKNGTENLKFTLIANPEGIVTISNLGNGIYVFKAAKEGETKISLTATNLNNRSVNHPTGFNVKVDKNAKATIDNIDIKLYPNPVKTTLNISTDSYTPQEFEVIFYNAEGIRVLNHTATAAKLIGDKINVSKLSAGIYNVVLKQGDKQKTQRITKL